MLDAPRHSNLPIWWSQSSVQSDAISPSSSGFFGCVFRLLGATATFCSCISAACAALRVPLPFGSAVLVAMLGLSPQYVRWWGTRMLRMRPIQVRASRRFVVAKGALRAMAAVIDGRLSLAGLRV